MAESDEHDVKAHLDMKSLGVRSAPRQNIDELDKMDSPLHAPH